MMTRIMRGFLIRDPRCLWSLVSHLTKHFNQETRKEFSMINISCSLCTSYLVTVSYSCLSSFFRAVVIVSPFFTIRLIHIIANIPSTRLPKRMF